MTDTPQRPRNDMPPVPRDYNEATHSELLPFKSKSINLLKSPIFYLVVVTGVLVITTFGYLGEVIDQGSERAFFNFMWASIGYLLLIVLLVMYLYSKSDKPFWAFLPHSAFVCVILLVPLVGGPYFWLFREVALGGGASMTSQQFGSAFVGMFVGAGLMEELMKVTLVLFGAYIAINAAHWKPRLPTKLYDILCVRGPLDGLMMGLFGGAAFILIETGFQYVPDTFRNVSQATGSGGMGATAGLMLLLPRVIGGMVGHMAWAGINGYFIGLAVIRPNGALKMILLSWVGTSVLHAIWNTQNFVPMFSYLSAGLGGAFVVACLLKARQLDMAMGRSVDSYGSIVVQPSAQPNAQSNAQASAQYQQAPAAAVSGSTPQTSNSPHLEANLAENNSSSAANSVTPFAAEIRLIFEHATVPIKMGQSLDFASIPSIGSRANGVLAEVTQHPTRPDVLGLKNLGPATWTAHLRDGSSQRIVPERNIRLAEGVTIDFGGGLVAEVML